jgi:CRISPR-associated protein Cmr2
MTFDYYAFLRQERICPETSDGRGLASGFVDGCTVWSCQSTRGSEGRSNPRNEARRCYINRVLALSHQLNLPEKELQLEPHYIYMPNSSWIGFEINFTLEMPWYSKDDRPFHVMDNPVRKDRVFGVPFMSAASWKGLLRWAYGMNACLIGPKQESNPVKITQAQKEIVHFFGNTKDEQEDFRSGVLVFYPTWFNSIGFEMINPHNRARRAGTQPIYYEVVPTGTSGQLNILYAPSPNEAKCHEVNVTDALGHLIDATELLLTKYGISAKRTVGWGTAHIDSWKEYSKNTEPLGSTETTSFKTKLGERLQSIGGTQ